MTLTSIYYLHEIGGKKNQEDYIWPAPGTAVPENKVFIICDGVGGSENGEVASRMIAEYTGNNLLQTAPEDISIDYINNLLEAAKQNLVAQALEEGLNKDMATTFSLLILFDDKAFIAWCGDSRVYHTRKGEILYKTADHSLVNTLVKNGEITEQEAAGHPQKHIILKAITGDDSPVLADGHWIYDLADDDFFMLCSDGLLENIKDADLNVLLAGNNAEHTDIARAIQEKCLGKTRDNYSMYLLQISLQTKSTVQKTRKRYGVLLFVLLAIIVIAGGVFFFNKKNIRAEGLPAPVVKNDSVPVPSSIVVIKADTVLQPGKNAVPDSEIIYKEEAEEKKIIPAPLPKTKLIADTARRKKTDSLSNHDKPLN